MSTADSSDVDVLRAVLTSVGGRVALAPVHAAASALLAELDAVNTGTAVPPGAIPDVGVPHKTRPRIDQPLSDPPPSKEMADPLFPGVPGDPYSGIVEAELVGESGIDQSVGGGVGAGFFPHESPTGFTDQGVPTWDSVRERVETRAGTALGAEELDHGTLAGRSLDEQWNEREAAGREKLDEIRRSMKDR